MGEHKAKALRRATFFERHPKCCLCGGLTDATEIDHIPPRACFPKGHMPEDFEFPACEACNKGSRDCDQIFGFYAHILDFNKRDQDVEEGRRLFKNLARFNPHALPKPPASIRERRHGLAALRLRPDEGQAIADVPLMQAPPAFRDAAIVIGRKLSCGLAYKHLGTPLTPAHRILTGWHQAQAPNMAELTDTLLSNAPGFVVGKRPNIKNYGDLFGYRYHSDEDERFFLYIAQWGWGLIVWGISATLETWERTEARRDPTKVPNTIYPVFGQ